MTGTPSETDIAMLWQRLRRSATQPELWLELARRYAACALPWQAGYAARQALRLDAALRPRLQALDMGPWQDAAKGDALLGRAALPEAAILAERFSARLAVCPGDWLTWLYLARLREMPAGPGAKQDAGQAGNAAPSPEHALQQARNLEPWPGESLHWMGVWRLNAGDGAGAVAALSGLLDIRPVRYGSMMYLGEALLRTGKVAAAEKAFARASLSSNPDFLLTLSARVYAHNYWQEAIAVLKKALTIEPASVPVLLALGKIQSEVYSLADCRETLRRLQALAPDNHEARLLEAGLQGRMGDAKGHLATLRMAYESSGDPLSRLASSIA